MNGKGASEDLPCDEKALVLQPARPGHPRPQDSLVLAGVQGDFLEDPFALAGVQDEVLAWVLAFPAVHHSLTPQEVSLQCWEEKDLAVFGKLGMVSFYSSSLAKGLFFLPPTWCYPRWVSPERSASDVWAGKICSQISQGWHASWPWWASS